MIDIEMIGLKKVVMDLLGDYKRSISFSILDHYFKKAKTLQEFDVLGELALKTEYRDLYLRCAETAYGVAYKSQEKYYARINLIKAYNAMNYPEKALHYVNIQLMITPDDFETLCLKAANISLTGDKDTAENIIFDLLKKFPEKTKDLESMLSGKYLREGHLVKGVVSFTEVYKPKHKMFEEQFGMKRWDGSIQPGKIVYVDGEGGIGDEIINIRFFDNIKKFGMRPILCSPDSKHYKDINNLFRRHGIEVLNESYSIDKKQFWIPMMSLPVPLHMTEEKLWTGPYIKPLRNPKNKLDGTKFKIGIKCSGNPFFAQDEYRKIPLELMLSYLPKNIDIY
jgi:hypothetical protein